MLPLLPPQPFCSNHPPETLNSFNPTFQIPNLHNPNFSNSEKLFAWKDHMRAIQSCTPQSLKFIHFFKINYFRRNLGSMKTAGIQIISMAFLGNKIGVRVWERLGGWVIGAHILYPKVASSSYNTSKSTSTLLAVIDHAKPPVSLSKGERLEICALK